MRDAGRVFAISLRVPVVGSPRSGRRPSQPVTPFPLPPAGPPLGPSWLAPFAVRPLARPLHFIFPFFSFCARCLFGTPIGCLPPLAIPCLSSSLPAVAIPRCPRLVVPEMATARVFALRRGAFCTVMPSRTVRRG